MKPGRMVVSEENRGPKEDGGHSLKPPCRRRLLVCYSISGTLGLLLAGVVASWILAGMLVAPKPRVIRSPPDGFPAIPISLPSHSGIVAGWHVPSEASKGVIVLIHQIRGSRLSMSERARFLHAAGYSIVMIDLQAHGESPGKQITAGYLEKHDVRAAVEFARETHPNETIGVLGVSLGGASALLATPLGIDALVLESVYPDIDRAVHNRVAAKLGPLSSIPAELLLLLLKLRLGISPSQLRPIDHLRDVGCPVFLISGAEDRHTTSTETREMFATARQPKELWLVDGAAHIDLYGFSPLAYERRLLRFLDEHLRKLTRRSESSRPVCAAG